MYHAILTINSNRRLDNKFNIFEGVTKNYFFMGINVIMVGLQVLIIFVGGEAFSVASNPKLDGRGWGYSIAFGFLSIPIGAAIRCIPDELVRSLIPQYFIRRAARVPQVQIEDEEAGEFSFPQPLADVKEELSFIKKMKGGRINNLKFRVELAKDNFRTRSRSGSRSRTNSVPHTPTGEETDVLPPPTPETNKRSRSKSNRSRSNSALGASAVMAGIVAGSIGGWAGSPVDRPAGQEGWGRDSVPQNVVPPSQREDGSVPARFSEQGPNVDESKRDVDHSVTKS